MRPNPCRSRRSRRCAGARFVLTAAAVEALDARRLLAAGDAGATLAGGVLTIRGTDGRDDIRLDVDPVYINLLRVRVNQSTERFLLGDYTTIDVRAARGDDRVEIGDLSAAGHPKTLRVDAGDGDDDVIGSPYADRLIGGPGDDRLRGNAGNDTLHGGDDRDTLIGDAGDDQLNGDRGNDDLSDNGGQNNVLYGNDGDDVIRFTRVKGADETALGLGRAYGGDGVDTLSAVQYEGYGAGLDTGTGVLEYTFGRSATLYGSAGNDRLEGFKMHGGDGDDQFSMPKQASMNHARFEVHGDSGNERIQFEGIQSGVFDGGSGNDEIRVGGGVINGGSGNDRIRIVNGSGSGNHRVGVTGGAGDDDIRDERYSELAGGGSFTGDAGNDTIISGGGPDQISGGDGNDSLDGFSGNDVIRGGSGNDTLRGDWGTDYLHGDDGDDHLHGSSEQPSYISAYYSDKPHLFVDPVTGDPITGLMTSGNDHAYGGKGRDWIDPEYKWAFVEADPKDDPKSAGGGNGVNPIGGGGGHGGTIGSVSNNGGDTYIPPTKPAANTPWRLVYEKAAVFVGTLGTKLTSAQANAIVVPQVSTSERSRIKGSLLHLPTDWSIARTDHTESGLAWYRVTRPSQAYAPVRMVDPDHYLSTTRPLMERPTIDRGVAFIGVHPRTLIVLDSAAGEVDARKWVATSGWDARVLVTKPGTRAILPGVASAFVFGQPNDVLPTVPKNTRAIVTTAGLILIDPKTGPRVQA